MIPFGQKIELHGFDFLRERKIQARRWARTISGRHAAAGRILHARKLHLDDWISARLKLSESTRFLRR